MYLFKILVNGCIITRKGTYEQAKAFKQKNNAQILYWQLYNN